MFPNENTIAVMIDAIGYVPVLNIYMTALIFCIAQVGVDYFGRGNDSGGFSPAICFICFKDYSDAINRNKSSNNYENATDQSHDPFGIYIL